MAVIAGAIASRFGAATGGLFLAFPAIFPASVTLVEKHVRQRKEEKRLRGARRGKEAAALDARGAALGGLGLVGFAGAIYVLIEYSVVLALVAATVLMGEYQRACLVMAGQALRRTKPLRAVYPCVDMQRPSPKASGLRYPQGCPLPPAAP